MNKLIIKSVEPFSQDNITTIEKYGRILEKDENNVLVECNDDNLETLDSLAKIMYGWSVHDKVEVSDDDSPAQSVESNLHIIYPYASKPHLELLNQAIGHLDVKFDRRIGFSHWQCYSPSFEYFDMFCHAIKPFGAIIEFTDDNGVVYKHDYSAAKADLCHFHNYEKYLRATEVLKKSPKHTVMHFTEFIEWSELGVLLGNAPEWYICEEAPAQEAVDGDTVTEWEQS